MNTSKHQLAETIAEVTNLKSLEVFRSEKLMLEEAQDIDAHLVDLSTRIIDALDVMPNPEEIEQPRETESNETPATADQPQPETDGVDNVPGSAVSGEDPGTPENPRESQITEQDPDPVPQKAAAKEPAGTVNGSTKPAISTRHPIAEDIDAYMKDNDLSLYKASQQLNITEQGLRNIVQGDTLKPRKKTLAKIKAVIRKTKPKKKPLTNGAGPLRQNKGPVQFVQLKLTCWMNRERLKNSDAAARMGVREDSIRAIMNGVMPHENILRRIASFVPDIHNNLHELIRQQRANQ